MSMAKKKELIYTIDVGEKAVIVESDFYVPFEPKKSSPQIREKVVELYNTLRESVKQLVVEEDEILFAAYSESDKNRFYDVENMLFFNIGCSAFSNCCKHSLAFVGDEERFSGLERTDVEDKYHYSYKVLKEKEIENMLLDKKIVASWDRVPIDTKIPQSATRYYATIRENLDCIDIQGRLEDKSLFGMVLDITLPTKVLPASVMKPLLDGLICAFHGEEGRAEQTLKMIFDNSMDLTISSKKLNLFGDREYVSQYRGENSYKWNPEDERLQFAWITVHTGKSAELSGNIYQWK